jgi:hypothetical protein
MRRIAALTAAWLTLAAGCDKKSDSVQLAPAASSLAASVSDASSMAWHYAVDPKSTTHVELPGLKEHIKGDTSAAAGALDITPTDLGQSRGAVRVDLATFETKTFGDDHDATQTKHARTWLEAEVGDKINEDMRWAEFAIRSIDNLSAKDLTKVPPVNLGQDDLRTVSMTVHGELLVHGHKVPKDGLVDVSFHYAAGASAESRPLRVEIKTKQPMPVVLKEHDVGPRDPAGQVLSWTTNLIAKVADTADVSVDIQATPAP